MSSFYPVVLSGTLQQRGEEYIDTLEREDKSNDRPMPWYLWFVQFLISTVAFGLGLDCIQSIDDNMSWYEGISAPSDHLKDDGQEKKFICSAGGIFTLLALAFGFISTLVWVCIEGVRYNVFDWKLLIITLVYMTGIILIIDGVNGYYAMTILQFVGTILLLAREYYIRN